MDRRGARPPLPSQQPAYDLTAAALAASGAAVLHAAAAGAHAEQATLARIFVTLAIAQGATAMVGFLRPSPRSAVAITVVNAGATAGWLLTRLTGLSDIPGLEAAERPGVGDSAAAILALIAVCASALALADRTAAGSRRGLASAAVVVAALAVPGMFDVTAHRHSHGHGHGADHDDTAHAAAPDHAHDDTAHAAAPDHAHDETPAVPRAAVSAAPDALTGTAGPVVDATADDHRHGVDRHRTDAVDHPHTHDAVTADLAAPGTVTPQAAVDAPPAAVWPRPWDPSGPIDFSGVPGVTPEQQARAEQLVAATLRELPAFADVSTLPEGYRSIGDAVTGYEHYLNLALLGDDKELDPTAPESLVYRVDDPADPAARTLVSAMYIARATDPNDPLLTEFGGPLMQWHNHDNLCWGRNAAGEFVVRGVIAEPGATCPPDTVNTGGEFPMVHVWIVPHECGPFAALEGHGAGQAGAVSAAERVDLCAHGHADHGDGHGTGGGHVDGPVPASYDPTRPIDLSGVPGVTPEQQAFAENLVADTVRNLPQWADYRTAEAAGFRSIGDGGTGHEHFIQWDWINDDVWLDPDFPESLVYEPQPDGSRRLASAMYMLPDDTPLDAVPDWGGALMQWHVHGDLCFTDDPVAPVVAGTKPIGQPCPPPLVDRGTAPMIHVWIVPHACGPFAALEGIGAGQVAPGETHACHAHGTHGG